MKQLWLYSLTQILSVMALLQRDLQEQWTQIQELMHMPSSLVHWEIRHQGGIHVTLPSLLHILCMVCKGRIMSDFAPCFSLRTSDELPGTGGHPQLYSFLFLLSVKTTWLIWQQPHKTLWTVAATTINQTKYCYNFHESLSKQLPFYIFPSMHCNSVSNVLTYKCTQLSFDSQ